MCLPQTPGVCPSPECVGRACMMRMPGFCVSVPGRGAVHMHTFIWMPRRALPLPPAAPDTAAKSHPAAGADPLSCVPRHPDTRHLSGQLLHGPVALDALARAPPPE